MKKFHVAIAVADIAKSIEDYSHRLGCEPCIIVDNEYVLWRTPMLNFSIRKTGEACGIVRHIGWEDSEAVQFIKEQDVNGLIWENFNFENQQAEIREIWPNVIFKNKV